MTHVNGLLLPSSLLRLLESGRWVMPVDHVLLTRYFPAVAPPDSNIGPRLYTLEEMQTETQHWVKMFPHAIAHTNASVEPVCPSTIVLIGDMGVGWDAPLALHFETSESRPVVLHLTWDGRHCGWTEIFRDTDALATALQL